jgi:23S rRNA (cytidine2498-2'-O)-methyltransferase
MERSMQAPDVSFVFATCQVGMEAWLKAEVAAAAPTWRSSFARPGFVTFKVPGATAPGAFPSVFARSHGCSCGAAEGGAEAAVRAHVEALVSAHGPVRLHAFARPGLDSTGWITQVESWRADWAELLLPPGLATAGEVVADVIALDPGLAWLGWHVHGGDHSPWPGGEPPLAAPADAPSRAYGKIVAALAWRGVAPRRGETALELGCAPGGAAYALLERGLDVIGVDPGAMSPAVAALADRQGRSFVHLRKPSGQVTRAELPRAVHWLLSDMNLAAPVVLAQVERLLPLVRRHLRGIFLTLKLNDRAVAHQVPALLARVRCWGFEDVRAAQLPPHRREIVVSGSTRR